MFWKILSPDQNGIFIAVNVLDTITNFGQVRISFFIVMVIMVHTYYSFLCRDSLSSLC